MDDHDFPGAVRLAEILNQPGLLDGRGDRVIPVVELAVERCHMHRADIKGVKPLGAGAVGRQLERLQVRLAVVGEDIMVAKHWIDRNRADQVPIGVIVSVVVTAFAAPRVDDITGVQDEVRFHGQHHLGDLVLRGVARAAVAHHGRRDRSIWSRRGMKRIQVARHAEGFGPVKVPCVRLEVGQAHGVDVCVVARDRPAEIGGLPEGDGTFTLQRRAPHDGRCGGSHVLNVRLNCEVDLDGEEVGTAVAA